MQYMLLIFSDESAFAQLTRDQMTEMMEAYIAYSKSLAAAGVLRGGSELARSSTATTVRVRNGKPLLSDGPFAETREQLGGYYLIEVPTLDDAIEWAAKIPSAAAGISTIEVRPQTDNQALKRV